jgi:hypothetical protein
MFGRLYQVCCECALVIASITECPVKFPCPDRVIKTNHKNQSKEAMIREIKKSKILKGAKSFRYEKDLENYIRSKR